MAGESHATFFALTPDRVLEAVEVGGLRCTGRCLPLRACENRVYEIELEDERRLIVKFYRPGRWSRETILDEHAFLLDLAAAEIPAVAPLDLGNGRTLNEIEGISYAAFPKVRGRTLDELDAEPPPRGPPRGRRRPARRAGRGAPPAHRPHDRPHARRRRGPRRAAPAAARRAALRPRAARGPGEGRLHPRHAGAALPRRRAPYRRRGRRAARRRPRAAHPRRPAHGQHPLGDRRPGPRGLRRLPGRPARAGPLAPRARRLGGGAPGARGPPGGLRAVPRVRPRDARALRAAARAAHRPHVGLDRAALGGSLVPAGLPELPRAPLLDAGVRGADRDRRGARGRGLTRRDRVAGGHPGPGGGERPPHAEAPAQRVGLLRGARAGRPH